MQHGEALEFGLLGPLEVSRQGAPLALGGTKPRAVLAVLLLNANRIVSADRLIDDLWGEQPPPSAQTTLQVYVSQLRRLLEPGHEKGTAYTVLVTAPPGYALRVTPKSLDLERFEGLAAEGVTALADGRPREAAETLREALALWRGRPLADLAFEQFAQAPVARLEELRLATLERRIEADLACGRHAELVGELRELCDAYPLREGRAAHAMLALYRAGRQAEALDVYQETRRTLVDELGIEPAPALQELERAILTQDQSLELRSAPEDRPDDALAPVQRDVLLVGGGSARDEGLFALGEQLASGGRPHELVLARLLDPAQSDDLEGVASSLAARRLELDARDVAARVAVFTSADAPSDIGRLVSRTETDLLLVSAPPDLLRDGRFGEDLSALLEAILCDVAFLLERKPEGDSLRQGPVLVPFGAGEHDWAALELGAWLSRGSQRPLHLLGTVAETEDGPRDASRLLADAGLLIQRASGVSPVPRLVGPGRDGTVEAAADGGLLVIGLSDRWREEGLGETRWSIARTATAPVLFVRRGLRPGGLAPDASLTRFAWSVTAAS